MAVAKLVSASAGSWKGRSRLHLPWLPPEKQVQESDSHLHIELDHRQAFATITYTWSHEGARQEGAILLCGEKAKKDLQLAWVDSWHQSSSVMLLAGAEQEDGSLKAKGVYEAEGQKWGWTIALAARDGDLILKMENVAPDGEADWAVEGRYTKDHS